MRILIAIGCNEYDFNNALNTAELDATRIFSALTRPECGQFDARASRLLLSPTFEELREGINSALFEHPNLENFTYYFAGHGGVSAGSFYMWVKNTRPNAQSASALSLAELFRGLNEAAPQQSNIIIDACESGGLIADLGTLLKPNLLGDVGTPALTLLATSAQNEFAKENASGGVGTNAILDCIEGRQFVQDYSSVLDLVEIGRRISTLFSGTGQTPVVWGLNLYGPPNFCRNPRFSLDPSAPLRELVQSWPQTGNIAVKANYDELWKAYQSITGPWNPSQFISTVGRILEPFNVNTQALANQSQRLAATFLSKASGCADPFRMPQVAACLAILLLPHCETNALARVAADLLNQCVSAVLAATSKLIDSLQTNSFALLPSDGGGLYGLYRTPIVVSKVLGWTAATSLVASDARQLELAETQFTKLLDFIFAHYDGSLITVSDTQAADWCVALKAMLRLNLMEEGSAFLGYLYKSLTDRNGMLASHNMPPDRVLDYLIASAANDFSECAELVSRPVDTITVLIRASKLMNLETVIDESLWKLDRLTCSAYLPTSYKAFNKIHMEDGRNIFWVVGHDVFRVEDVEATWPTDVPAPESELVASLAILASLLFEDRVPWFLLEASSKT